MSAISALALLSHKLPSSRWKVRAGRVLAAGLSGLGLDVVSPVRLRDGAILILDPRGRTEGGPFWNGTYDDDQVDFLCLCLSTLGEHLLDIGANVGLISIRVARAGATVEAVEPVAENAARIAASARLSGVADRINIQQLALGETGGTMTLTREVGLGAATGNAVDSSIAGTLKGISVTVPQVRLDDLELAAVDVIKIDVEGNEVFTLRGGMKTIEQFRPVILGEFNSELMPLHGHSFLDVAELLDPLDYRYFQFVSATEITEQKPRIGLGNAIAAPTEKVRSLPATIVG
ncbi:MAG TPA: FkbM family methyltransferase [Acidimicrobiales bacterium]|jgi:FkbM family methyltransferase